nr:LPS export ABC transporter permease LptF [Salinihabitans flavidus]
MSRFDRYLLSQFMVLFGFFALVLVAVYWVNRAVVLFDRLIGDGQTAGVFLEFTVLSLTGVVSLVLPMSAFAAAVYVTNRLSSDSELTVMQATGFSPWRLARPVVLFGCLVALMMAMLMHFLVPASLAQLDKRQTEISQNVSARLLSEGSFLHPSPGITFYIRQIAPDGVLRDIFVSDRRKGQEVITHTAAEAYLLRDDNGPKLVMVDGLTQIHRRDIDRLFTTNFADFSIDISALVDSDRSDGRQLRHLSTHELLTRSEAVAAELGLGRGSVLEEAHDRFNQPIMCLVAALIGFATLLTGGYSRFGVWRQIVTAFVLLILVEVLKNSVTDPVRGNADLWPITYLPSVAGLGIALSLLALSARPLNLWRRLAQ